LVRVREGAAGRRDTASPPGLNRAGSCACTVVIAARRCPDRYGEKRQGVWGKNDPLAPRQAGWRSSCPSRVAHLQTAHRPLPCCPCTSDVTTGAMRSRAGDAAARSRYDTPAIRPASRWLSPRLVGLRPAHVQSLDGPPASRGGRRQHPPPPAKKKKKKHRHVNAATSPPPARCGRQHPSAPPATIGPDLARPAGNDRGRSPAGRQSPLSSPRAGPRLQSVTGGRAPEERASADSGLEPGGPRLIHDPDDFMAAAADESYPATCRTPVAMSTGPRRSAAGINSSDSLPSLIERCDLIACLWPRYTAARRLGCCHLCPAARCKRQAPRFGGWRVQQRQHWPVRRRRDHTTTPTRPASGRCAKAAGCATPVPATAPLPARRSSSPCANPAVLTQSSSHALARDEIPEPSYALHPIPHALGLSWEHSHRIRDGS